MATASGATSRIRPIEALNRLTEMMSGFFISQVLATACKLGVFERLANGPAGPGELAELLNIHPEGCRRLLAALRTLGLLEHEAGAYRNSDLAEFLTSRAAVPMESVSMLGDPFYHMWEFLPDALGEYSPRWQQALGTTAQETWAAMYENPARLRRFTQILNAYGIPIGQEIAEHFDFTPYHCVLDVAGGPGGVSIQIGLRHSHLRGIIADLSPVCSIAQENIAASGLANRFTTAPFDLFSGSYPSGADAIVLSAILHDWSDEKGCVILRNCFQALPPRGVLLISEAVLNNDDSGTRFAHFSDLQMLLVCDPGARERTESEYRSLLEETGFQSVELIRLDAPRDLIIARKP